MSGDVVADAQPFIQQCGSCDAGLPMNCTCPSGDFRPVMARLVAEVERLHSDLARRVLDSYQEETVKPAGEAE